MKKNRLIFYSAFGLLLLFIFVFSVYMDNNSQDFDLLLKLHKQIWLLKFCSFALLVMFVTGLILHARDIKRHKKSTEDFQKEITELKAKLYDKANKA